MTDQVKKIQELEQTVAQLKIRAFDAGEIAQQQAQLAEGFKSVIVQIAGIVGLTQDAEITTDDVVKAVQALVPVEKATEFEPVTE